MIHGHGMMVMIHVRLNFYQSFLAETDISTKFIFIGVDVWKSIDY